MPFDGTVEWVLQHAMEARDLIESQRELLRAYHVRLAEFQPAPQKAAPKVPLRRVVVPESAPWWKVWA